MSAPVHRISAEIFLNGTTWYPLPVEEATVTVDTTWQPYVQVSLTCPAVAAATSSDPRVSPAQRIRLTLTETAGTTVTTVTVLNLSVRSSEYVAETGSQIIRASSAEADVQDKAYLSSSLPLGPSSWAGVREAVQDLLVTYCGIPVGNIDFTALPLLTSPTLVSGMVLQPGDPWWPTVQDMPTRIGWQLWCGIDGIWRLSEAAPTPSASVYTLRIGANIETYAKAMTREGDQWADTACVVYAWTDSGGAHRIIGAATVVGTQTKAVRVDESFLVTQAQADARAAQLVQLARRRGATYTMTLPSHYDIRARTFVDVIDQAGTVTKVYVSRVQWSLPSATMTVTAREV